MKRITRPGGFKWSEIGLVALTIIGAMVFAISMWYVQASIESSTYNRLTGGNVTVWEAMWTNIRVDCNGR